MHKYALFAVLAAVLWVPSTASAEKFAGDWMTTGAGARALGMGGSFTAVANDASTVYYNPAGLSGFTRNEAIFMHAEQFGDLLNYNYGGLVVPSSIFGDERETAFGFALIHMGAPDIPVTNQLQWQENNGVPGFQPEDGDRLNYDPNNIPRESNNDFALFSSLAVKTG